MTSNRKLIWISCLTLYVAVLGATAVGEVRTTPGPDEISFKLHHGYVVVARGAIGKLKNLNFVIDTGAVPSIVDSRVAQKLGLIGTSGTVSVFSKNIRSEEAMVRDIELGPVRAPSTRVLLQDLSFIEGALGVRIDALIGLDVLGQRNFCIDYESKQIGFGMSIGAADSLGVAASNVGFENNPGFAVVQLEFQGHAYRLMVDTGSSDLVLFRSRVQDGLPALRVIGTKIKTTVGGEEELPVIELAGALLGSAKLEDQQADLLNGGAPASANLDGLLGVVSLGVKRITFDFDFKIIQWVRSSPRRSPHTLAERRGGTQ